MTLQSFVDAVGSLSGELESSQDGEECARALRVPFDQLGPLQELAVEHDLEVKPLNRYTCYVDTPGGSSEAIEVTATVPAMHVAQLYANNLVTLELTIAQASNNPGARLEELLAHGSPDRASFWDRSAIWLDQVVPETALNAELGSSVKPNSALAEVLATLLADAGVGSAITGTGMEAFSLGSTFRVLAAIDRLTTSRLLIQPTR